MAAYTLTRRELLLRLGGARRILSIWEHNERC